jgi:hypothetical protein
MAFELLEPSDAGLPATDDAQAGAASASVPMTVMPASIRGPKKRRTEPAIA